MSHVRQQRMNKVKILVISEKRSENIFEPQTMNFAFGTLFCDFLDFRQFTVEIQARIIQKITKIDSCFFLRLHSTINFDLPRCRPKPELSHPKC